MLRMALYFKLPERALNASTHLILDEGCKFVVAKKVGDYVELWICASNVEGIARLIELLLNNGLTLLGIGCLDGTLLSMDYVSFTREELVALGSRDLQLHDEIVVEAIGGDNIAKKISFLLVDLRVRYAKVLVRKRRAYLKLCSPVKASRFFDEGFRLISPVKAPPPLPKFLDFLYSVLK